MGDYVSDEQARRTLAREHLDAIEMELARATTRLEAMKTKFERSFRSRPDPADPQRLGFELEQAAFQIERARLQALRDAAKEHYLKTFPGKKL